VEQSTKNVSSNIADRVVERISGAPSCAEPFPYLYLEDVFSSEFYTEMLEQIPSRDAYRRIADTGRAGNAYEQRLILNLKALDALPTAQRQFWQNLAGWFLGSEFASALIGKFHRTLAEAIGKDLRQLHYGAEGMLVKDLDGYQIGPHTDLKSRAISIMFYLPADNRHERHGTSLYIPRDPSFRSDGSRHFEFDAFEKVATMPYKANAMFGFPRTTASFHGVEPIREAGIERDVLLYILRWGD